MHNVIPFPCSPKPPIKRIDINKLTTDNLRLLCGNVIDASIKVEKKSDEIEYACLRWFLINSTRQQLENLVDWIYGGMKNDATG